jgi:putative lipoic acid-binding regulatory protein
MGWDKQSIVVVSTQTNQMMNFPCVFPIKVMGANQDDFESLVLEIIQKHASIATEEVVPPRLSRGGRFLSVTVHIMVESQEQLDAIYGELSAHERVLMML